MPRKDIEERFQDRFRALSRNKIALYNTITILKIRVTSALHA